MFNKLSPKVKVAVSVVLVFSGFLLIGAAIIVGSREPKVEPKAKPETVKTYEAPADPVEQPDPLALPDESNKAAAEKTAAAFVSAFHRIDPKDPLGYIDDSKPFMTERLYLEYKGIPKRGTLDAAMVESVHQELLPAELEEKMQVWTVGVTSREVASDGTEEMVLVTYSVLLIKDGQKWLVDGVRINEVVRN